jgi:endonuclease-3
MRKKEKATLIYAKLVELFPNPETELTYTHDYEMLFAVIMSAQTTDVQVNKLTDKLYEKYRSLEDFANADLEILTKDMSSIGLYRAKAKNVQAAARLLIEKFDSKVPQTMEELITIPGAARKTANVVMHHLFNNPQGIAVDTHVKRLSKQLGLTKHDDVKKIEQDLMKLFPQQEWGNFSIRLILYGRYYSPARGKIENDPLAEYKVA